MNLFSHFESYYITECAEMTELLAVLLYVCLSAANSLYPHAMVGI